MLPSNKHRHRHTAISRVSSVCHLKSIWLLEFGPPFLFSLDAKQTHSTFDSIFFLLDMAVCFSHSYFIFYLVKVYEQINESRRKANNDFVHWKLKIFFLFRYFALSHHQAHKKSGTTAKKMSWQLYLLSLPIVEWWEISTTEFSQCPNSHTQKKSRNVSKNCLGTLYDRVEKGNCDVYWMKFVYCSTLSSSVESLESFFLFSFSVFSSHQQQQPRYYIIIQWRDWRGVFHLLRLSTYFMRELELDGNTRNTNFLSFHFRVDWISLSVLMKFEFY